MKFEINLEERYELSVLRIKEIEKDGLLADSKFDDYFKKTAAFLSEMSEVKEYVGSGKLYEASLEELKEHNEKLYKDILLPGYETSYANPEYAVKMFGDKFGQMFTFLYAELRNIIVYAYEKDLEAIVIRMELFLEVCSSFSYAYAEKGDLPEAEEVRQILYWFTMDYSEIESEKMMADQVCPEKDFAVRIIMESDLNDLRYLYYFGEYITDSELKTAKHLNHMAEEKIKLMADTFSEGFRIGFEIGSKDITKKKTVNIRYHIGFERMISASIKNFAKLNLKPVIYRANNSVFHGKGVHKVGYYGATANKQYDYDHKDDLALLLDKQAISRKLEEKRAAFELFKKEASLLAGPAVLEVFGETPFAPKTKKEALSYTDKQQKLLVEYMSSYGMMRNEYIKGEETSFTIISFPTPSIGEKYEEIFDETVKINTLDYKLYQKIQQTIIDTLDLGEYVLIKGMGVNKTNLKVQLHTLNNPEKETNFENCVADVNIPVGEVFTSPKLSKTGGLLHVSRVFLNELEYKDLKIILEDGMVTDYDCSNFDKEEENKKYIKDNVLFHHDTLPIGEFAIGTNTSAYMTAKKYDIGSVLPILIAEKMGPHFALGDTCYSNEEDIMSYNPDGKAIIARDNEVSALRNTDRSKAYFNCHTDITIPYDELGEISVVTKDNRVIPIIIEGRFVLSGCEELNKPFEEQQD